MKSYLVFAFAILFHAAAFCQLDFVPDSNTSDHDFRLDSLLNKSARLDTSFDFEFRLWSRHALIDLSEVFVMSWKASKWHARYFQFQKGKFIERPVNQGRLDSLWAEVTYHKVLILPDQNILRDHMRKYIADTSYVLNKDAEYSSAQVSDGISYRFELAGKSKKRTYEYHCPAAYLTLYPNIEELYRAYAIIILIRKYLDLPLTAC
jgi:hypothetical protein